MYLGKVGAIMKHLLLLFILFTLMIVSLISCDLGPESPRGFSLPEGNVDSGKLVFLKYQCLACHQVAGLQAPEGTINNDKYNIKLGGKSTQVKTYADLLTSVINPSHKFAKGYALSVVQYDGVSKMKNYNDVMTVSELVNLTTFLQSNYQLVPYRRTVY